MWRWKNVFSPTRETTKELFYIVTWIHLPSFHCQGKSKSRNQSKGEPSYYYYHSNCHNSKLKGMDGGGAVVGD